jgi:membrane protease YdiL (CAAX protease family)
VKSLLQTGLSLLALFVLGGSLLGWTAALSRLRLGWPLLPWRRRRLPPWGILDVLLLILAFAGVHVGIALGLRQFVDLQPQAGEQKILLYAEVHWATSLGHFLWMAIAALALVGWREARAQDLGISRHVGRDLLLGAQAFVLLAPLVYVLQFILVQFWPSHHPLVEALRQQATPQLLVAGAVTAIIAAPLFEEFAFRVLLQGSLERLTAYAHFHLRGARSSYNDTPHDTRPHDTRPHDTRPHDTRPHDTGPHDTGPHDAGAQDAGAQDAGAHNTRGTAAAQPAAASVAPQPNPYAAPQTTSRPRRIAALLEPEWNERIPWRWRILPIVGSGTVFALMHMDHGPDWLPLLILGLGLGYLYQRTGRILPCITVHFLLNANSYGILLLELMK